MQQPPQRPKIIAAGIAPQAPVRPKIAANQPPKSQGKIALAILARVALGVAGMVFYTAIFFIVVIIIMMNFLVNRLDAGVWGGSTRRSDENTQKWNNRIMWMWIDGFVETVKFIFTGRDTNILKTFFRSVGKPLIKISSQYWDQETRRL